MAASSRQRYLQASTCARAARDLERIAAGHVHRLAVERPPPRPCPRVPLQVETDDRGGRPVRDERHRSEEHTSELQSLRHLVCRLLLEKKTSTACNFRPP